MRKLIYTIVAFGALAWSGAAWAVLQETTVTLTDHGKPLPEATVTLNRLTDSQPPPQPKTEKTDDSGKVVIVHDKEDQKSDSTVELIVTTSEGKTLTRRAVLRELLKSESIDVAVPSEAQEGSEAIAECPDLTHLDDPHLREILTSLDDEQLQRIVDNPELRSRITKLIEETKQTEETRQIEETKTEEAKQTEVLKQKKESEKVQEGKKGTEKKTISGKSKETKERKTVQKKGGKHPTASAAPKSGSGAAEVVGTGLAIGLGIAGSHHSHGLEHHGHAMESGHSMGVEGNGGRGVGVGF
jgi:hypothetical protein